MTRNQRNGLSLSLFAIGLTSCAPLGAVTTLTSTALAGTLYTRSQTVERTFVAPIREVNEACHRALEEMGFTIKDGDTENQYRIVAVATDEYEVEIDIAPVTSKATKVSVNADSLPERDKATGQEIINQIAIALSPPPPQRLAFPTIEEERDPQRVIDTDAPSFPLLKTVQPALAQIPTNMPPPPVTAKAGSPSNLLAGNQDFVQVAPPQVRGQQNVFNLHQLYERGIHQYIQGDFPSATRHFRMYLAALSDRNQKPKALYWLGESLYSQREYAKALVQFQTIIRDYPQSPETPRALFRGALAYRQLGKTRQAEALLEALIKQHPRSHEAQLTGAAMTGH